MNGLDLAPWPHLKNELYSWEQTVSDTARCLDLVRPRKVVPQCALTDPLCPTLLLLDFLMGMHYRPRLAMVEHMLPLGVDIFFDSRSCHTRNKKLYFQALLDLPGFLAANRSIVSDGHAASVVLGCP